MMIEREFLQWIKDGYRPKTEIASDGGYLVPSRLFVDKKGVIAKLFRFIGVLFSDKALYSLGIDIINPQEEIKKMISRKANE